MLVVIGLFCMAHLDGHQYKCTFLLRLKPYPMKGVLALVCSCNAHCDDHSVAAVLSWLNCSLHTAAAVVKLGLEVATALLSSYSSVSLYHADYSVTFEYHRLLAPSEAGHEMQQQCTMSACITGLLPTICNVARAEPGQPGIILGFSLNLRRKL